MIKVVGISTKTIDIFEVGFTLQGGMSEHAYLITLHVSRVKLCLTTSEKEFYNFNLAIDAFRSSGPHQDGARNSSKNWSFRYLISIPGCIQTTNHP